MNTPPCSSGQNCGPCGLTFWEKEAMVGQPAATSSVSGSSRSSSYCRASHSDEEVKLLESRRPKRPTGRKKFKETRHPVYRGVRRRGNGKWVCELREPTKQKRIWVGTYPTPEMAARAHDVAALALRGQFATLNFADSAWRLPVPLSKNAKDIRKAAVEAVKGFRPREGADICCVQTTKVEDQEVQSSMRIETNKVDDDLWTPSLIGDETGMEGSIEKMAEAVLYSPAAASACMQLGRTAFSNWDQMELETDVVEVSLWSYSI